MLTQIVRHWDWDDHFPLVNKFGTVASTPPRVALMMLQGGRLGPSTMQRLVHRRQLFATRALTQSENSTGVGSTYEVELKESEDASWQNQGRVKLESKVCPQELVPAVVRGELRRLRLGEQSDVLYNSTETWEVFVANMSCLRSPA